MFSVLTPLHSITAATRSFAPLQRLSISAVGYACPSPLVKSGRASKRNNVAFAKSLKRVKYSQANSRPALGEPLFLQVEPDASDAWRLDVVVEGLKSGSVGIGLHAAFNAVLT